MMKTLIKSQLSFDKPKHIPKVENITPQLHPNLQKNRQKITIRKWFYIKRRFSKTLTCF